MARSHQCAVQVAKLIPCLQPGLSPSRLGRVRPLAPSRLPCPATGPRSWLPMDGSCGFHSEPSSVALVSSWPSCLSAELSLQHPGVLRSRGGRLEEILRHLGGRRPRVTQPRSALGSLVHLHQLTEEPHQDPVLAQHGLVGLRQAPRGRDAGLASVAKSVDRAFERGAHTASQRHRLVENASPSVAPEGLADRASDRTVQTLNWPRKRGRLPVLKAFIIRNKNGLSGSAIAMTITW